MVNRMLSVFVAGAVMIGSSQFCLAVLGETEEEVKKRYGEEIDVDEKPDWAKPADKHIVFSRRDGMATSVYIRGGLSVGEVHTFKDANLEELSLKENLDKAVARLEANGQGGKWGPAFKAGKNGICWMRTGGVGEWAIAIVPTDDPHTLEIWNGPFSSEMDKHRGK